MNEDMKAIVDGIDKECRDKAVKVITDISADAAETISSLEGRGSSVEVDRLRAALVVLHLVKSASIVFDSDIFSEEEREFAKAIADNVDEQTGDLPDTDGCIGIAVVRA